MSNETKIGLMATIVIAVFIWGYKFVQGRNLFSSNTQVLVELNDVGELQESAPVMKNGLQVGTVTQIYFSSDDMDKVIINLDIDSKLKVPKSARAELYSQGFMGGRAVRLKFSKPCSGEDCVESGGYIQGVSLGLLGSMVDPTDIPTYMEQLGEGGKALIESIDSTLDNPDAQTSGLGKVVGDLAATLDQLRG
ncbi:MAG: MCE family protein, partial [Saprospiraceae bacterium]|nr:MCE family protein [Saprospiraceae bacterium]